MQQYISDLIDSSKFNSDKLGYVKNIRLALQMVLVQTAGKMTKSLVHLRNILDSVEEQIFNADTIKKLNKKELIGFYRMVLDTNATYTEFIQSFLKDTDWHNLDGMLLESEASNKMKKQLPEAEVQGQ